MRKKGLLTREEAIKIVGGNTVKAVGYVERKSPGTELIEEGLVEFVTSIDAIDLDGQAVTLSAYYYQAMDIMTYGVREKPRSLEWKISGYKVRQRHFNHL